MDRSEGMAAWSTEESSVARTQWQQAEEIFVAALKLPKNCRREYVATLDIDDRVRAQVNLLLAGQEVSDGPLRSADAHPFATDSASLQATIGPYRLLELIGRGGMGAVYRAERADGHFQKQVAIKLIHSEVASPRSVDRFCSERQILAGLEHSGVARLLDGGVGADGQPYIVMEYVHGVPIHEYCRQKSLSCVQVLRLFQQVCSAIQFVHSHGIIHRDIKPSNILVTPEGTAKLLDFGIAKLLSEPAAIDPSLPQDSAMEASRPFTPDYASPEQLLGKPATFSCDVYSLGVLLYELLSGEKPFRLTGELFPEELAILFDKSPVPPSKTTMTKKSWRISPEVDAITLKALRMEPRLRYQSPQEFSSDIRRYLDDRPVMARDYSFLERALKLIHRRRRGLLVACAFLLIAAGFLWEGYSARRERHKAEERFRESWQSSVSLIDKVDKDLVKLPNSWTARRQLLSQALAQLEALAVGPEVSAPLKYDLARTYIKLGGAQDGVGWQGTADFPAMIKSYQYAAKLLHEIQYDAHVSLSDVLLTLSMVYRFTTGPAMGMRNYSYALQNANDAISVLAPLQPDKTADPRVLTGLAMALVNKGDVEELSDDTDPTPYWTKARQIYLALIEEGSQKSDSVYGLLRVELKLSFHYCYAGDPARGMTHARTALQLNRELTQLNHPLASWLATASHERMGVCYAHQHHPTLAYAEFNRLVVGVSRVAEQNPEDLIPREQLAWAYVKRAKALLTMKDITRAQRDYQRAIALANTFPPIPEDMLRVPLWAMAYSGLSVVEREQSHGEKHFQHDKLACEYASRAHHFFDLLQKHHFMDLDEREEIGLVSRQLAACAPD